MFGYKLVKKKDFVSAENISYAIDHLDVCFKELGRINKIINSIDLPIEVKFDIWKSCTSSAGAILAAEINMLPGDFSFSLPVTKKDEA